ncbi:MAG: Ycf48-like protein [Gemmatimonadaceae bacterium]|nr:Ycf48-like protein [Gemmatimonadaceae bacterium]
MVATLLISAALPAQTTWQSLPIASTASFRGLHVVNDRVIWATGSQGTFLRSVDGGATWTTGTIPGAARFDIRSLHASSEQVAFAGATAGRIWMTTDGGKTWSLRYQAADTAVFIDAIAFWDSRRGMALADPIGGHFALLVTSDGGATWQEAPAASRPPTRDGEAAFAASGTSLVLLPDGVALIGSGASAARVHRSTDWGKSWTAVDVPIQSGNGVNGIFSLAFQNARSGIAVGGNYRAPDSTRATAAVTGDGGVSWTPARSMVSGYRSGAAVTPAGLALAVGTNGTDVSFDGGRSWTSLNPQGFNAVSIAPNGMAFAVGDRGALARLDTRQLKAR